jgi:hypothetical protein
MQALTLPNTPEVREATRHALIAFKLEMLLRALKAAQVQKVYTASEFAPCFRYIDQAMKDAEKALQVAQ